MNTSAATNKRSADAFVRKLVLAGNELADERIRAPIARALPELQPLTRRLSEIFSPSDRSGAQLEVVSRKPSAMTSTFQNEVVHCRLPDGSMKRLFVKYQINDGYDAFGHRGGVRYEAEVYRH